MDEVKMDGEAEACTHFTHFEIFATRALRQGEKIVVGWEWDDVDAVHRVGEVRGAYFIIIFSPAFRTTFLPSV
jgi:hypothetical protein